MELTVAVTGPTGEIGMSVVRALEQDDRVGRILGMARRPFDPVALGWRKTEYRRGDVLDRAVVDKLVADADVVVHLAFAILGSRDQTSDINLQGSRNVFEATVAAARPNRLVYTSSLAAYGYHADNPVPITEDVAARGSDQHYYSQQKAACENMLAEVTAFSPELEVYVLRPCIVAGPEATLLIRSLPWQQIAERLPGPVRRLLGGVPFVRPVLLDPGVPFQLVHHDDVAAAVRAAVLGAGEPGPYNLAADGEITMTDLAHALGDHAVPVPHELARLTARVVEVLPLLPAEAEWIHAVRHPMLMDTGKARRQLGWAPEYTARQTLTALAGAVR
ncbi:MAG: UDP-glucose 4-epimerase [Streptosporangiaceae bacterium]|jgi:UDP-glucose 4-epimerase|nr:epimerase [Streptosporangiaceae bacterium]MDX6430166.1 UDP-glucose 4-epimerase [Streptosporangiaceae bacterium]